MSNHILAYWATLTILTLWPIARILQGSWLAPGSLLVAIWSIATLAPLVVSPDYAIYPEAYVLSLAFVVSGLAGSSVPLLLSGRVIPRRITENTASSEASGWLRPVYRLCVAIGLVAPWLLYRITSRRFNPASLTELSSMVTQARYTGEFDVPLSVTVMNAFSYLAAILGGYFTTTRLPRAFKGENLLFFIPLVFYWLLLTTRSVVAIGGLLYVSGVIAGSLSSGAEARVKLGWLFQRTAALLVLGTALMIAGQLYRWASTTRQLEALAYSRVTLTGQMTALGTWFETNRGGLDHVSTPGALTFAGVVDKLGWDERRMGLFTDFVVPDRHNAHIGTNIYTAWRALVSDFTVAGGLVFFFTLSMLGGYGASKLRAGDESGSGPLVVYASFVLYSPVTSIFAYNSLLLALTLFTGLTLLASGAGWARETSRRGGAPEAKSLPLETGGPRFGALKRDEVRLWRSRSRPMTHPNELGIKPRDRNLGTCWLTG